MPTHGHGPQIDSRSFDRWPPNCPPNSIDMYYALGLPQERQWRLCRIFSPGRALHA